MDANGFKDSLFPLIIRMPNWLGDVIMTLPALQALLDCSIPLILIGKPWIFDLFTEMPLKILGLKQNFFENRKLLMSLPSPNCLLMTNSFSSACLAAASFKKSIAYQNDGRRFLLSKSFKKKLKQHEVEVFWTIAQHALHFFYPKKEFPQCIPKWVHLPLRDDRLIEARKRLEQMNVDFPFTVLCPAALGAGQNGKSKIWPYWKKLANSLDKNSLVVCPGINEEELCASLLPGVKQLPGLGLHEYAAVLALSRQVIANDSGPMHLAAAVGVPVLGLFGVTDPERTRPWGQPYLGSVEHGWPDLKSVMRALEYLDLNTGDIPDV